MQLSPIFAPHNMSSHVYYVLFKTVFPHYVIAEWESDGV